MYVVLGPTACGKTKYAVNLALQTNGEIISADSRQIFRGMDIGTGKDLKDYTVDNQHILYHLIDIREAGDTYSVYQFVKDFEIAYADIMAHGKTPILCGGTGLYISAVVENYQFNHPATEKTPNNASFSHHNCNIIGLFPGRAEVMRRIGLRLQERLENGMIEEVHNLLNNGISYEKMQSYGLEYKFVSQYLKGILTYDEMFRLLNIAIRQFAKRQMTWFRKMERSDVKIEWIC
ncbi:MAG: tRNA (adenosine(37)-N6)-dimethylallyltransferase MiaA [Bacteroidales bacterium]|nr:tRNA (adenosine(37)-N6)-dimethylallyltransferase MiaA [Bacteroidales bacterium]